MNVTEVNEGGPCPDCGANDPSVLGEELTIGRADGRATHSAVCACGWRGKVLRVKSREPAPSSSNWREATDAYLRRLFAVADWEPQTPGSRAVAEMHRRMVFGERGKP